MKCVRNITSAIIPLLAARAATAQKKELLMWQTQNVIKPVGNASKFGLCVLETRHEWFASMLFSGVWGGNGKFKLFTLQCEENGFYPL